MEQLHLNILPFTTGSSRGTVFWFMKIIKLLLIHGSFYLFFISLLYLMDMLTLLWTDLLLVVVNSVTHLLTTVVSSSQKLCLVVYTNYW